MLLHRRLLYALLVPAGTYLGHTIGYLVSDARAHRGSPASDGHAYLGVLATFVVPLGVAAIIGFALVSGPLAGRRGLPRTSRLAAAQGAAFAVQELLERVLHGRQPDELLVEPAFWCGLAAQVLVAWMLVSVAGTLRVVAAHLVAQVTHSAEGVATEPILFPAAPNRSGGLLAYSIMRRGPPVAAVPSTFSRPEGCTR